MLRAEKQLLSSSVKGPLDKLDLNNRDTQGKNMKTAKSKGSLGSKAQKVSLSPSALAMQQQISQTQKLN